MAGDAGKEGLAALPRHNGSSGSWSRVDGIDLLRGLAIVFVLCNHVNMRLLGAHMHYLAYLPAWLGPVVAWNGQTAVQMFFVLSGYLITSTSVRRWGGPRQLRVRSFYGLRFARIAPLLLSVVLLLSLLHLLGVHGFRVHDETGGLGRAIAAALTFHINYLEATRGYLPGGWDILWSLGVEEMFYLAFPLVARLFGRRVAWLVGVLLVFVALGPLARTRRFDPNPVWREYSYLGGMDGIAMGCLTAMWLGSQRIPRAARRAAAWLGGALVALVFLLPGAVPVGVARAGLTFTGLAIGVALTIVAAVSSQWRAPRALKPLLVLGQRSYEVYLTHMFPLLLVWAAFARGGAPMWAVPLVFVVVIALAGFLGWGVGVCFAEPANRLLRKLLGVGRSHAEPRVD